MPLYICPKCGRTVELPEGTYYCKECGPSARMVEVVVSDKIQKILVSHDWVWVKIDGKWFETELRHDALYEPEQWVNEIIYIQRMNAEEFMEKYRPHELAKEYWGDAEKYSTIPCITREELEKKAGWLKLTHSKP